MVGLLLKEEVYEIIGCAMEVHSQLGNGFLESVYQEAMSIEMTHCQIPFVKEKRLIITYKGIELAKYYCADFVCYDKIIVELKALSEITTEHDAQIINYLKATGIRVGLLINFGAKSLQYKRLVL